MITNPKQRMILHYLFKIIYAAAFYMYKALKFIFKPLVHLHPRIYRFSITVREAIKDLIRPPEIVPPFMSQEEILVPNQAPIPEQEEKENRFPEWLLEEWREIHEIEPQIFPDKWLVEHIPVYEVPESRIVEPYLELCKLYGQDVSHVFLVPWLVRGGADLVVIHYVESLSKQNLAKNIVVISTLNVESPWKARLPKNVRFIEFGKHYHALSPEEQEKLVIRLFLQMEPSVIHNINSDLGYRVFVKYGNALSSVSKLFACSFCLDMMEDGRYAGYPVWYLPKCFDMLEAVLSENYAHLDKLEELYALDKAKMYVHYQPAPPIPRKKQFNANDLEKKYLEILWAGRLDRQKRPDILIEVAAKSIAFPFRFHVFGSTLLDMDIYTRSIQELENISYWGPFDGLPSLPMEKYDVFLYTSQWDGLPNVLLESISMGLPVIASDVGGISELIEHEHTGFLITPYDDVDAYVECLQKINIYRSLLPKMADNAYQRVSSRHSWAAFNQNVRETPGYSLISPSTKDGD